MHYNSEAVALEERNPVLNEHIRKESDLHWGPKEGFSEEIMLKLRSKVLRLLYRNKLSKEVGKRYAKALWQREYGRSKELKEGQSA